MLIWNGKKISPPSVAFVGGKGKSSTIGGKIQTEIKTTGGVTAKEEDLPSEEFLGVVGWVEFSAGRTINLGDYNTARVGVRVLLPTYPSKLDETFNTCKDYVDSKMDMMMKEIEKAIG